MGEGVRTICFDLLDKLVVLSSQFRPFGEVVLAAGAVKLCSYF